MDAPLQALKARSRALSVAAAAGPYVHVCFVVAVSVGLAYITRWEATVGTAFLATFLAVWVVCSVLAAFRPQRIGKLALAITLIALVPLASKWLLRIGFVIRHGGMDCASCQGSPLVFLFHWLLESAVLFPGILSALFLWYAIRSQRVNT